jgi:hypothetical protein
MIIERRPLDEVAAAMKMFAQLNPYRHAAPIVSFRRALPRGLEITCLIHERGWYYLEIARVNVMPSPQEEAIIRREFGVPEDAERAAQSNVLRNGGGTRCAIRWTWKAQ